MTSINVVKNSGSTEKFDAEKANRVVEWACEGLDVCASEILMKAQIQMFDGVTTKAIHETLIKAASDLISVQNPDYQYAAARLLLFKIRKEAYGDFQPFDLFHQIYLNVGNGKYDRHLLDDYTRDEIAFLNDKIVHDRDFDYTYAAMRQYEDKYLVKNRVTGEIYESPQMALMLIAMGLLSKEDKKTRLDRIVDLYENVSLMKVSLPTPIMAGVRTPTRQFSSCVLIESGDDINQIFNANTAQGKYAAQRAGIGLNFGMIRGQDAAIRGGEVKHAGTVPIVRMYQESLGWTSQGGVRKASANYFYPMWHWDFESLIVLKNNRGTESTRARHVDYGLQINKLLYTRLQHGKNITLFHPNVAGGKLYEYFFSDQEKFQQLYEELEADPSVAKKSISAADAFSVFGQERSQTGRIYVQHVDHCNTNSPFDPKQAPVKQSNLCMEIALPTHPINDINDPKDPGEVALCTLSAINLGKIEKLEDMREPVRTLVRALDRLLDYQNYPVLAAEKTKLRRTLGIGWTNLAYYLAKRGLKYSDPRAANAVHELAEAFQYYLLEASVDLAKELGKCDLFHETTYSQGILPIDRYKKEVDALHTAELKMDWEKLRLDIALHGLRNSTLSTMMPCETSSQITNSTNGFEPPRDAISFKKSSAGMLPVLVPGVEDPSVVYEYKWDMDSPLPYLGLVAIMQKFIDQAASANTFYKPWDFPGGKLPIKVVLRDIMWAYKHGLKTLYYQETKDGNDQDDDGCGGGACKL
ncbi:ribonucleotide reductase of class Ia (aerobic), alpha subunit [Enterobacter phage vB_ExiM_F5M1E]|nr:ribonucleotide reductase of class Ia (aerobic), alpha subunit [Enterobacter phage vB_ExiM_F1M1E]UNA03498.1 ribonucleotide reductase of class Ia (aerobic), alpha subunit [Enterobacter phage vB_ExiM_F4M1E]UNA03819.1 ribonucleotide reductase of class Ia (aerobic), alpha subunit [Enterobacter phage vB_ExiM_F5M1E]UNA04139.1 ribonucleotide reductase of class Ia (aerobic), alpha subunit [Pantoea phage vB_PdiM_F5M2A]